MSEFRDESGNKFGRLTVVKRLENRVATQGNGKGKQYVRYQCECDCGNIHEADVNALRSGGTRSCGCLSMEAKLKNLSGGRNKWKGGRIKSTQGYINIYKPDHPSSINGKGSARKYVLEHRLVMEEHLGRYLTDNETVHHKNGIKTDNRIENLELWTKNHSMGQRVNDLTKFAIEHLKQYAPELLK